MSFSSQAGVQFQAVVGLGLPGQVLVRASSSDAAAVSRALAGNPWVASFSPNLSLGGQVLLNDPRFGEQTGLQNTGQAERANDADIDALA